MLFTAMAMRGPMLGILEEMGLLDRHYFHLLGMDLMFGDDGNPRILELNDRPSMIRRPVDQNEEQNIELLTEELDIIFNGSSPNKWEMLYPHPPPGLIGVEQIVNELNDLNIGY
jgi:hypothetical protein